VRASAGERAYAARKSGARLAQALITFGVVQARAPDERALIAGRARRAFNAAALPEEHGDDHSRNQGERSHGEGDSSPSHR